MRNVGAIKGTAGFVTMEAISRLQQRIDALDRVVNLLIQNGEIVIQHDAIIDTGSHVHVDIDTHIENDAIHFTEGTVDHDAILNNGTNSHALIDTHLDAGVAAHDQIDRALRAFDGAIVETIEISVTAVGAVTTFTLEDDASSGTLTVLFAGVEYTIAEPATRVLIAGTDAVPVLNYVYITESGGVLTLDRSTSWPATAHAPIATVLCQSSTGSTSSIDTVGAYKVHAWTDHLNKSTENGHIQHINRKIRQAHADWESGVAAGDIGSDDIIVAGGYVYQMHSHAMPALTVSTHGAWVVNDPDAAYTKISGTSPGPLQSIDKLSDGTPIGTNKYINLVLWGCVSEATADCKLFFNVPDTQYNNLADATADASRSSDYSISTDFRGCGFLIAKYITKYNGTSHAQQTKTDLRGLFPATSPGGSAAGTPTFLTVSAAARPTASDYSHGQPIIWRNTSDDSEELLVCMSTDDEATLQWMLLGSPS